MKSVEVRVRELAGLGEESTGVDLMNRAFGPKGALTDTAAVKGEQEGRRMRLRRRLCNPAQPVGTSRDQLRQRRRSRRGRHDCQPADAHPRPRRAPRERLRPGLSKLGVRSLLCTSTGGPPRWVLAQPATFDAVFVRKDVVAE